MVYGCPGDEESLMDLSERTYLMDSIGTDAFPELLDEVLASS